MKNKPVTYAFIDSQNANVGVFMGHGWKLDFKRFRVYLKDKYNVSKAFLFIGYIPGKNKLYNRLKRAGYILIFKPTIVYKKHSKKTIKGNVDAELVLHAMIQYKHYNKAIIVSGDGDFFCLIEYLEKSKKLGKIFIPDSRHYSMLLKKYKQYFVFMVRLQSKLEIKKRGSDLRTEP